VLLTVYAFMTFILANLYVSSMAAILARRSVPTDIRSMEDLSGLPVGIFLDDRTAFQRFALTVGANDMHIRAYASSKPWCPYGTAEQPCHCGRHVPCLFKRSAVPSNNVGLS
jgi:hypothetical protein